MVHTMLLLDSSYFPRYSGTHHVIIRDQSRDGLKVDDNKHEQAPADLFFSFPSRQTEPSLDYIIDYSDLRIYPHYLAGSRLPAL